MKTLPLKVLKFGGTSVGSAAKVRLVADLIDGETASSRVVVVVSALAGVTDLLDELAKTFSPALLFQVEGRHLAMAEELLTGARKTAYQSELAVIVQEVRYQLRRGTATREEILAIGERLSAPLLSFVLLERGISAVSVDARDLIQTRSGEEVDLESSALNIRTWYEALPEGQLPIVTGFIARSAAGATSLLGRGGSDYSAALFAAALDAVKLDRWTDVDGIHTSDPRRGDSANRFVFLLQEDAHTWNEASQLGMHRRAFEPVLDACIPVHVRSLDRPQGDGTLIFPRKLPTRVRRDSRKLWHLQSERK